MITDIGAYKAACDDVREVFDKHDLTIFDARIVLMKVRDDLEQTRGHIIRSAMEAK